MGLQRMWRQVRRKDRPHNLIAVSDLHLGQDLKASARGSLFPGTAQLDRQLVAFLDHYAAQRSEDKPWHLILNGDIIDFVAITITPPPGEVPFQVKDEERVFGLAPDEAKCIWKLRKVFGRHAAVFDALARFVLAGNSVSLIRGNHDAEFSWPGVKAEFKRLLADRAGVVGAARRRLERQIEFHDWFYLEPGFFYAEHGNAHDRYCMPEDFLAPWKKAQAAGSELDLPMSSKVMRFFANKYASQFDLDEADSWGVKEFLAWTFRMGNPLQIAADYFVMCWRLVYPIAKQSLRLGRAAANAARRAMTGSEDETVRYVNKQLSRFTHNTRDKAQQLLAIASRPAEQSLFDSMQLFYLDRMLLALACLVTAGLAVVTAHGWLARLLSVGAVGVLFAALNAMLGSRRQTDAHPMLQKAARRVSQLFDVKYIVMGHSHRMVNEAVGARTRYFNLGSWTAPPPHKPFEGFPHLVVADGKAEMRRWAAPATAAQARPTPVDEMVPATA
jgi:UDP-2,3-diacylglucosamine pyrophosphatase LpxH